jgi:ubiquitin carboxyl-terminal hydrolase 7
VVPLRKVSTMLTIPLSDDIIYDHKFLPEDVLGLDHIDKTGKAGRSGPGEKAIVIKG